jgi:hypothetical protein
MCIVFKAKHNSWGLVILISKLQHMFGKCNWTSTHGISVGSAVLTSEANFTDIFSSFSSICSSDNSFRTVKDHTETLSFNFFFLFTDVYNASFSVGELLTVLQHCCNMSIAPTSITKCCVTFHPQARGFCCP